MFMTIRWKVKGKSTEALFTVKINNKDVPFVGLKEFDAKQGMFIWRLKGQGLPEGFTRQTYDLKTRTFYGRSSHPDGAKEYDTFQIINKNKRLFETQVKKDGKQYLRAKPPLPDLLKTNSIMAIKSRCLPCLIHTTDSQCKGFVEANTIEATASPQQPGEEPPQAKAAPLRRCFNGPADCETVLITRSVR